MNRQFSAIPYLEAANWSRDFPPVKKRLIVLHCMEYAKKPDSAEWCARYFAGLEGPAPQASAHACVDSDSIVQCVPWDRVAWHAPGANRFGIGVEHSGYRRQSLSEWQDPYSTMMLDLSSWLVGELCTRNVIPIDFLDADELRAAGENAKGITTHWEVTKAFGKSDHTDPGPSFPMGNYLRLVSKYALDAGSI